jgi:PadR family transcriptional regulator, regulatory protein PadR
MRKEENEKPYINTINKELMGVSGIPMILLVVKEAGESYGYEISRKINELTGGKVVWQDGSLYPLLHKLERRELLRSMWRHHQGKKRKYYTISEKGKIELINLLNQWFLVNSAIKELCFQDTISRFIKMDA